MIKKKNNFICISAIIISLVTAFLTFYYINSNPQGSNSNQYGNNQGEYSNPFGNNGSTPDPSSNIDNNSFHLSWKTVTIITLCAISFSLATIYLTMTRFSNKNIFVNQDKKTIYGLASSLLSVMIIFGGIIAINRVQQNSLSQENNKQQNNYNEDDSIVNEENDFLI